ncbi:MAG: hypothetical protein EYC70_08515 [Planctomycetota bacterium]|nr:MAG: hypothetical protein EYC70_08515 [Planctomycetota bacterium]
MLLSASAPAQAPAEAQPRRPLAADTQRQNGYDRDVDLLKIELDLTLDHRDKSVYGTATSEVRAFPGGAETLTLHAHGLEIEAIYDGHDRPLGWMQEDDRLRIWFAVPLRGDETESVSLRYRAQPEKGLYFVERSEFSPRPSPQIWSQGQDEDHHNWFPLWDYPNDRAGFEAWFRVFDGLKVVSNGTLLGVRQSTDGSATWHWQFRQAFAPYLISVAAGRWEAYFDTWRGKRIGYYVPEGCDAATARRSFGETPQMLSFFSDAIGVPYPYEKYDQVAVSEFLYGGMENITATTQTDRTLHDARAALDQSSRGLVAHELAHQWFGDLLTCRGWDELWLNEGFATYFQCLYDEHRLGHDYFELEMEDVRRSYLAAAGGAGDESRLPMVEDFRSRCKQEGGGSHVYSKGAAVLHMIRRELGDEGWWRAIELYVRRHQWDLVETQDFERAIFDATGRNLRSLFEQWVHCGGFPRFTIAQDWTPATSTLRLTVRQTQPTDELVPIFSVPVSLQFYFDFGIALREDIQVTAAEQSIEFSLPERPLNVVFDADAVLPAVIEHAKPAEWWAYQAENDPNAACRRRALDVLAGLPGAEPAVISLRRVLADRKQEAGLRAAAAAALLPHGESARAALLGGLRDESAQVREACVRSLAQLPQDERTLEALRFTLRNDKSYAVVIGCAETFAAWKAAEARTDLEWLTEQHSWRNQLYRAAAAALQQLDAAADQGPAPATPREPSPDPGY